MTHGMPADRSAACASAAETAPECISEKVVAGNAFSIHSGSSSGSWRSRASTPVRFSSSASSSERPRRRTSASNTFSAIGVRSLLRSEEHTSELQSQSNLVCRLLLEKKKKKNNLHTEDY